MDPAHRKVLEASYAAIADSDFVMNADKDHHEYCTGGFDADDIVISGISGQFPSCANVGELRDNLLAKKEMVFFTNERFEKGAGGMAFSSCGNIADIDKFDNDYFCITSSTVERMDPAHRKVLEASYAAIADSGYDVSDLKGANIGVYNGTVTDDTKEVGLSQDYPMTTSLLLGMARVMSANMCSRCFDFHGPSFSVDSACSSSAVAFWCAYNDLREGRVDAAVVNACQLNLNPLVARSYSAITSPTGKCSPFDAEANGILRTEAATAVFLQKASVARRVYATVLSVDHVAGGFVPEGLGVPSLPMQIHIFEKNLKAAGLSPEAIDFIEAHGTGTSVGDPIELKAINQVYLRGKKKPLYIGTIKSNLGHSEAASGLSSVFKALIAFETGFIPPNFGFNKPNQDCEALVSGKMQVVTEPIPLSSSYIPVNNFGIGGSLVQILLKQNPITYCNHEREQRLPRLLLYSANTEEAILYLFRYVEGKPELKDEFFALLNKLAFSPTLLKPYRGYAILENTKTSVMKIKHSYHSKTEVWFVMTGMGCQYLGMGLELMEIDTFANSMKNSAETLKLVGIDLFELLRKDKNYLNVDRSIIPAFVTIAAIQIALVDLLHYVNIRPDGILGHSVGELVAAYADGCCTAEQTILSAYWRGKSVEMSNLPFGAMAAVGLSWEKAKERCPENVYPACHNAEDSVTISGLKKPLEDFVSKLQEEKIFARTVDVYGYSFHSKLVHPAAENLKSNLSKFFPSPKERSKRWISSSFPEEEWNSPNCKVAGPEYFTHNLISPVLFNDAVKKIPHDAVVIEIGPHCLLQSLLKRVIGARSKCIGLMNRTAENNLNYFLESLGNLYTEGLNPLIEKLYPPVKFPVPRSTPIISDLIKYNHSVTFELPVWTPNTGGIRHSFVLQGTDNYLLDHRIDGRALYPAAGYIYLAWKSLAKRSNCNYDELSFCIEDFKIHRALILNEPAEIKFEVFIQNKQRGFEILEGNSLLASGKISKLANTEFTEPQPTEVSDESSVISGKDLYNELRILGYEYGPKFRELLQINMNGTEGTVAWNDNWITFLDALLLFFGLTNAKSSLYLPTGAQSIKVNPILFKKYVADNLEKKHRGMPVTYNPDSRICSSVGVEITKLVMNPAPRRLNFDDANFMEYKFIPYIYNYNPSKESKRKLSLYKSACNHYLDLIGQSLNTDVNHAKFADVDIEYTDSDTQWDDKSMENILLAVLKHMPTNNSNNFLEKEKELFHSYVQNMGKDTLNNILITEIPLSIMLDIIAENTYRKLNMLELNRSSSALLPTIMDVVKTGSFTGFKNTVLASPPNSFNISYLETLGIKWRSSEDMTALIEEKNQDVVLSSFICGTFSELQVLMHDVCSIVKPNGFILLYFKSKATPPERFLSSISGEVLPVVTDTELQNTLESENLATVSKLSDSLGGSLYLLRRLFPIVSYGVVHVTDKSCEWVEDLKAHLSKDSAENIWLVSNDDTSGIIGMVNCLKREPGGERIRCVFAPRTNGETHLSLGDLEKLIDTSLLKNNLFMNVWHEGAFGSFRHISLEKEKPVQNVEHSFIICKKYGDLSSFEWRESSVQYTDTPEKDIVHIYYSALNFRDVMLATGKLSVGAVKDFDVGTGSVIGMEFSGRRTSGKRVAGFLPVNGLATAAIAEDKTCMDVPDHWTLEEAVTVPVVYATCYYALLIRAKLQRRESILIHSGTGGIGLAAIAIALDLECEIFTTVGSEQKKAYLKAKFPQIKHENIGCSRDASFEGMISSRTRGRGVDVVLNSLADEKFQASLRCVAQHGRFVEIGKFDLFMDRPIGLRIFLKNISFYGVSLDQLTDPAGSLKATEELEEVMRLLRDGCKNNVVVPLDRTVFKRTEAETAFRYMAAGTHVGKVLIKIRDEEPMKNAIPKTLRLPAIPSTLFYDRKVYIVIGGLGGFGIEVTKWMLNKGAKHVILTSRYGVRSPYHQLCLKRWAKRGLHVHVSTLNVAKKDEAQKLLIEAEAVGPVGGIFNSAVVLKDAFIENQTAAMFEEVCEPKATATKHLDELSRKLCPALDYFVCFSSISCGRGNAGQSNYGYANSVMERICEKRMSAGLHGLAIQWGIIGDVGVVHRHMGDDAMIAGVRAQGVNSCLLSLDAFCQLGRPVVCSYVSAASVVKVKSAKKDVIAKLMHILGLKEISETNKSRTFLEIGIDSMMGTEIMQLMETSTDLSLSIQDMQQMKLGNLIELLDKDKPDKGTDIKSSHLFTTTIVDLRGFLSAKETIINLNTVTTGTPVFFVIPGYGDISLLRVIAESISNPIFALLWTRDVPATDIQSLADWCLKAIENASGGPFHLVGYSVCGSLAFEMTLQDEEKGRHVNTFSLLGGSSVLINALTGGNIDSEVTTLCTLVELLIPGGVPKLDAELRNTKDLDQQIKIVSNILISCSAEPVNESDIWEAILSYLNTMKLVRTYIPKKRLDKDLTVIDDSSRLLSNDITEYKAALSEVCNGKIHIHRQVLDVSEKEDCQGITEILNSVFKSK